MKIRFKNIALALLCSAALLLSGIVPGTTLEVKAATIFSKEWFSEMRQSFEDWQKDSQDVIAGAIGSAINDDNILNGVVLGSLLNMDANYYHQPTKIFDKVNNSYKDTSSSTSLPNCVYSYEGGNDYSSTSNYHVFQDYSTSQSYNFEWYNPITQTYNYTDNFYYNYDYDTYYYQTTNNNFQYDFYYIDNSTYMTYYIIETDSESGEESEYQYDIYYELPDGRNSYDLTEEEVWGTYFIYDVLNYESVAEDDGTTLGLWHFDGNLNDSSYWNNDAGISDEISYSSGKFGQSKYIGSSQRESYNDYSTVLNLNNCDFDKSKPFTLEWVELHPSVPEDVTTGDVLYSYDMFYIFPDYLFATGKHFNIFTYYAIVYDGSSYSFFVNGIRENLISYNDSDGATKFKTSRVCGFDISNDFISISSGYFTYKLLSNMWYYISTMHDGSLIDEMRLSKGVLYKSNYSPSAEPFTTNSVLVVPDKVKENNILLFSNVPITDYRIGGARQTFPTNGSVYVALENDVVSSVQQYQTNQWVEVDARVYVDGKTQTFKGYDMAAFKLIDPSAPGEDSGSDDSGDSSGDSSGSSGSGSGSDDDDGGGGDGFSALIDAFGNFFDTVLDMCANVLEMITDLIASIFDMLSMFTGFSSGFADFLSATFSFIPAEVWSLIGAGLALTIVVGFIKMIRG